MKNIYIYEYGHLLVQYLSGKRLNKLTKGIQSSQKLRRVLVVN